MSDDQARNQEREVFIPEVIDNDEPTVPIAPGDVASAARSCQAIILIMLALALIGCVVVVVAVFQ